MTSEHKESVGIIVLGMHRSGTSLLAKTLQMSGVWLGEEEYISEKGVDNPTGFWEHADIRNINQCLLEASGANWDSVLKFDLKKVPAHIGQHLWKEGNEVIADLRKKKVWAIKDPRLCLTLPWWRPMIRKAVVVFVTRSPLDIARSLEVRNSIPKDVGIALWEHYSLCAVINSMGMPRIVVNYDQLVDDPIKTQASLVKSLSSMGVVNLSIADPKELSQFVSPEFRHSKSELQNTHVELNESQLTIFEEIQVGNTPEFGKTKLSMDSKQKLEEYEGALGIIAGSALQQFSELQSELMLKLSTSVSQIECIGQDYKRDLLGIRNAMVSVRKEQVKAKKDLTGLIMSLADLTSGLNIEEISGHQRKTEEEVRRLREELSGLRSDFKRANEESKVQKELQHVLDTTIDRLDESELMIDGLSKENKLLKNWLSSTFGLMQNTLNSARWTLGNSLVRVVEVALFRKKPHLAMDAMVELQQQFKNFENSSEKQLPSGRSILNSGADEFDYGLEPDSKTSKSSHDIIIFPIIDWHFRIQRPQHIARELAKSGNRVFYLCLEPALGALEAGFEIIEKPSHRVHLVRLLIPSKEFPNVYTGALQKIQINQLLDALYVLTRKLEVANTLALVDLPFWGPVAHALPGTPLIYDCMDHHGGFSTATKKADAQEKQLVEQCDLLVVTSHWLWKQFKNVPKKCLIPNAGEVNFFRNKPDNPIEFGHGPIVGYVGAIADWFDVDLVVKVARCRPKVQFVLVGSTAFCNTEPLLNLENVTLVGEVSYEEVPRYVHAFDCCFIPFQLTELIMATNPVKIYEYLAAGKPVVSTNLPELEPISNLVHLAKTEDDFVTLVDVALGESADKALADRRSNWAIEHDWSHRRDSLLVEVDNLYPKVSVIVLCYNNLEFTKDCLKSLLGVGCYPNIEIIVVDNGSTDGTCGYLQELESKTVDLKVITNSDNLGFSAGNNVGIKAAEGDYIILLNNDTYATPGWVFGLVRHMTRDPGLGLIGPVTNNIGNEAKINIHYSSMESMIETSFKYTRDHKDDLLYVPTIAFFCVAFSRELLEKVGVLDEQFGQGFFEDDDYCRRVSDAGYKIAIAEDVFVHHQLSATFSKEDKGKRDQLFATNKKKFESKWGKWKPHEYR